jgi:hypothetical protein
MQTIDTHQSDILWKFYAKAFTLKGKVVEAPENLCRYMQTASVGFGLWLHDEVRLSYLWLVCVISFVLFVGLMLAPATLLGDVLMSALIVPFVCSFGVAVFISLERLKDRLMARLDQYIPWIGGLLALSVIGIGLYSLVQDIYQNGFSVSDVIFLTAMKWMLYISGVVFGFCLLNLWAFKTLPERYLDRYVGLVMALAPHVESMAGKVQRLFVTIGNSARAKKQQVCPPVNPPADFKVEPKV